MSRNTLAIRSKAMLVAAMMSRAARDQNASVGETLLAVAMLVASMEGQVTDGGAKATLDGILEIVGTLTHEQRELIQKVAKRGRSVTQAIQ